MENLGKDGTKKAMPEDLVVLYQVGMKIFGLSQKDA